MRLIDADALEKFLKRLRRELPKESRDFFTRDEMILNFQQYVHMQPTIDAVPVVRGEWLVTDAYPHRVYCSACYKTNVLNEEWLFEKNEYPHFCMWCGAKMESESGT
jgi:hypothetical protein